MSRPKRTKPDKNHGLVLKALEKHNIKPVKDKKGGGKNWYYCNFSGHGLIVIDRQSLGGIDTDWHIIFDGVFFISVEIKDPTDGKRGWSKLTAGEEKANELLSFFWLVETEQELLDRLYEFGALVDDNALAGWSKK